MKCTACGTEVVETSVYCHRCGERLDFQKDAETSPGSAGGDDPSREFPSRTRPAEFDDTATGRLRASLESAKRGDETVEQEIWQGGYCGKAMMGAWVASGLATLGFFVAAVALGRSAVWWIALAAVVLLWGYQLVVFARRRLGVHYRLTSERFFHEKGILIHKTDLIEMIDVDDIMFSQNLIERMLGVGTIEIVSSDRSHPDLLITGIDDVKSVAAKMHEARRAERLRRGLHIESI